MNINALIKIADGFSNRAVHGMRPVRHAQNVSKTEKEHPYEAEFYKNVVAPIKKKFGGRPGIDYDEYGYIDPLRIRKYAIGKNRFVSGYYDPLTGNANVAATGDDFRDGRTGVHERMHGLAAGRPGVLGVIRYLGRSRPGVSDLEARKLDEAYGFTEDDMKIYPWPLRGGMTMDEEHSTNGEYQYGIYYALSKGLGRPATYEEYANHVKSMSADQMAKIIQNGCPNGYMSHNLNRGHKEYIADRLKRYTDAWERGVRPGGKEGDAMDDLIREESMENWMPGYRLRKDADKYRRAWLEVSRSGSSGGRRIAA